jgi:hypothetical protein
MKKFGAKMMSSWLLMDTAELGSATPCIITALTLERKNESL